MYLCLDSNECKLFPFTEEQWLLLGLCLAGYERCHQSWSNAIIFLTYFLFPARPEPPLRRSDRGRFQETQDVLYVEHWLAMTGLMYKASYESFTCIFLVAEHGIVYLNCFQRAGFGWCWSHLWYSWHSIMSRRKQLVLLSCYEPCQANSHWKSHTQIHTHICRI